MTSIRRFAASGAGPTWAGSVSAVPDGKRHGPRVRKPISATQARAIAAKANAAIAARRATVDAAPVLSLLDACRLGIRPDVPMPGVDVPGVVRVETVEAGYVHTGYDAKGEPTYGVKTDFVPGETLGRRWLKHPRTSQSQVALPSDYVRRPVETYHLPDGTTETVTSERKVVERRGTRRIGNLPSDLVDDRLKPIVNLMRPSH